MKIVFLTPSISIVGGAERVTTVLANGLSQQGHDVTIVSLYQDSAPAYEVDSAVTVYSLFHKKVQMRSQAFVMCRKIRAFMQEKSPDLWIDTAHGLSYLTITASFGLHIPIVFHSHSSFKGAKDFLHRLSLLMLKVWAHKFICISKADALSFQNFLGKSDKRIICIPNPLPFSIEKYPPKIENKILLCIAGNYFDKGLDRLLNIFEIIHNDFHDVSLKIVGKACQDPELHAHLGRLDFKECITLVPHTTDIKQVYLESTLTLMTSRQEVFPMILIESMACGIPVIAYNCHTGPDEIIQHGVTGYVVEEDDAESFITYARELIQNTDRKYQMAVNSIKLAHNYDLNQILIQWKTKVINQRL